MSNDKVGKPANGKAIIIDLPVISAKDIIIFGALILLIINAVLSSSTQINSVRQDIGIIQMDSLIEDLRSNLTKQNEAREFADLRVALSLSYLEKSIEDTIESGSVMAVIDSVNIISDKDRKQSLKSVNSQILERVLGYASNDSKIQSIGRKS